jgi:hypothetical protein
MNSAFSLRLPGGQLPSGKSMEETLQLVRKDLWDQDEQGSAAKNKDHKIYDLGLIISLRTLHRLIRIGFLLAKPSMMT